jgi:hypothetical protein
MTKIYDLAVVEDRGAYWRVNNVVQNTMDNLADKNEKVLKLSFLSHQMIRDAILAGKAVHIPKAALRSVEVLPGDFEVIELANEDELQATKRASIVKVRMLVQPILSKISGFALYGFITLNNDLSAGGYFITNENREEKYLAILETGDEKLIAKLEDYLNYKDELEDIASLERKFAKYQKEMKNLTTLEDVKNLEDRFLEDFFTYNF